MYRRHKVECRLCKKLIKVDAEDIDKAIICKNCFIKHGLWKLWYGKWS